jgi:F0F1-type ATP synthase delta subunit
VEHSVPAATTSPAPAIKRSDLLFTPEIVGRHDIVRLLRELDALNTYLQQLQIKEPNKPIELPKVSRILDGFADANKLSLTDEKAREALMKKLEKVKNEAPVMHISFATDPSAAFVEQVLTWFRRNIDEHTLFVIGLQPSITAGFTLRTENKYFDFSMREQLMNSVPILAKEISTAASVASQPVGARA